MHHCAGRTEQCSLQKDFAAVSHCAEIKFHPSGRWLFAPNRALPETGCCSVAVLGVGAEGELSLSEICLLDPVPAGFSPQHISLDSSGDYCYIGKAARLSLDRLESRLRFSKDSTRSSLHACGGPRR